MECYINYSGRRLDFTIPSGWNVISEADKAAPQVAADPVAEVGRALDNPIGSPKLEELVKPGMDVVLLFDDLQRPTPAHLAIPQMLDRINKAGVPDGRVTAVCATGTHPVLSTEQLAGKVGPEAARRLAGRLLCHDAKSPENITIGRTHRGMLVELNRQVALADIVVAVGECMPHPTAGYGGGYKIIMPGVASYRSVAEHHFALMRNRNSKVNLLDGNPFWEEIVDAGRLSRLAFKLDFVMNEKKQVLKAFAGNPEAEQRAGAGFAESLYVMNLPHQADITITSAAPLEIGVQATKALHMGCGATRSGGTVVWVAAQKEAGPILPLIKEMAASRSATEVHRDFVDGHIADSLKPFGISYIMQIVHFKDFVEKCRIVHVTEGLTAEQVTMMGMEYSNDLQKTVDSLAAKMPKADVAIFPSGGNVIPRVL